MTTSASSDPRSRQLRTWYDQLTARIAAADKDIGRALSELDRQIHRERLADLAADRELVAAYLDALEQDQPLPGPWLPEFKTADLLPALAFRFPGKSGRCDFYRHVPLPPNYVPRPELLAEVRANLLADSETLALTSAVKMDALHGMGGIGKSVLARALCDDPAVQTAFPDGILWATLGQTPDLIGRLREWIDALGGIVSETAPTADRLKAILADLLRERACLLIVDDVWQKAHVEHFRVAGPRGRLLLTTRDAALAEELGGRIHPVPVMAQAEAVALLEEWAGGKVEAEIKAKIVRRLGCLPLAVKLAGAQLARKDPVEWLASFDARRLKARRVETLHDSLEATFALSLDDLAPADRRLYAALAIFKEDEPAPAVAIGRLWSALDGRDAAEADELLDDLAARALLAHSRQDGDAVTVHDLLRDFMAAELGADGRLAAHRALLASYRATQAALGAWPTAQDDGYLYDHLAYHLDQLADHDPTADAELRGLFAGQDWLHARVPASGYLYDGYLADLALVWSRADATTRRQIATDDEPVAFAACVRCALIRTSVNSLAANYDPSLVARAVETGHWSAARAFSILRQIPDPQRKATLTTALLNVSVLSPPEREQAVQVGLAAAQALGDKWSRAQALPALAPYLTGADREQALQAELAAATAIADEGDRAHALAALAPQLTGAAREQALATGLAAALTIGKEGDRAHALAALAPQLTGATREQALATGLAAALTIGKEGDRAHALTALAPYLMGADREQALQAGLTAAQTISNEESRAAALAALVPQLTGAAREQALQAGLAAVRNILFWDGPSRVRALAALVPYLRGELLQAALTTARNILDVECRGAALATLIPHFTGDLLPEGLAAAQAIEDNRYRAKALTSLAPHLTGAAREEALQGGLAAVRAIEDDGARAAALAALAPQLTDELLRAGLSAAQAIDNEESRVEALAALVPHLTGAAREQALQAGLTAAQAAEGWYRTQTLVVLLPHLTGAARQQALQAELAAAQVMHDECLADAEHRARALATLAPHLTGEILQAGLARAQATGDELFRARALAALAPHLTGATREQALQAGLAAAQAIWNVQNRAAALTVLAPHLTGTVREQALQVGLAAAQAIREGEARAKALAALAPHLTGTAREQALQAGLDATLYIHDGDEWTRTARALAALAPHLTGKLLEKGLDKAAVIFEPLPRSEILVALAPQLTGKLARRGLAAARAISDEEARVRALAALAPQLTGTARAQALRAGLVAVQALWYEPTRVRALAALAPHLADAAREQALQAGLAAAQAIRDEVSRAKALAALAPHLTGVAREQALQAGLAAAQAIRDEQPCAQALAALAPQLTGELGRAALAAALAIRDEYYRAQALAALLPHVPDADSCLRAIRHAITDHLRNNLINRKREDMLEFIADSNLFAPPILSPDTLAAVAGHIIEICQEWEWL